MSENNFNFRGKFFEKEEDLWEYVKEWSLMKIDREGFESVWKFVGIDLWLNLELREIQISNGKMRCILEENLLRLLESFSKKSELETVDD